MDSTKLAAYEHSRAPIKYEIADRICEEFDICQRWLATGDLPRNYYIVISKNVRSTFSGSALFSEVFDSHLEQIIDDHIAGLARTFACKESEVDGGMAEQIRSNPAGSEPHEIVRNILISIARLKSVRDGMASSDFVDQLTDLFDEVFQDNDSRRTNVPRTKAPQLIRDLLHQIETYCIQLPPAEEENFLRQILSYAQTLGENYAHPRPAGTLMLANSREPLFDYRNALIDLLGLPSNATDTQLSKAQKQRVQKRSSKAVTAK